MKFKLLIALLLLNAAYVAALPSATIFYVANVLLHVVLGLAGVIVLCWQWRRSPKIAVLVVTALLGGFLLVKGAITDNRWALWSHIALGVVGLAILLPRGRWRAGLAALTILAATLRFGWPVDWQRDRITNPETVPVSMAEEGAGPKSPFWPSGANTNTGKIIPSDFFMDSELCGECHKDIYQQWKSSMHHFASFNNQFYREYRRTHAGVERNAGQQVVRRMSRSRRILQRPLRPSHQRASGHARSAERSGMRLLPLHHAREWLGGERRLHHRISAPAQLGVQQKSMDQEGQRVHHLSQSRTAPPHVHEAFHAPGLVRVLLGLPQSPSGPAREQLPLAPRFQRIRQLAGQRSLGTRRTVVLLSGRIRHLREVPHAAGALAGSG